MPSQPVIQVIGKNKRMDLHLQFILAYKLKISYLCIKKSTGGKNHP
jgi:hypothetical protein